MAMSLGHTAERHRDSSQQAGITKEVWKGFLRVHLRPVLDVPRSFACLCRRGVTSTGTASPSSLLGGTSQRMLIMHSLVLVTAVQTSSASHSSSHERQSSAAEQTRGLTSFIIYPPNVLRAHARVLSTISRSCESRWCRIGVHSERTRIPASSVARVPEIRSHLSIESLPHAPPAQCAYLSIVDLFLKFTLI